MGDIDIEDAVAKVGEVLLAQFRLLEGGISVVEEDLGNLAQAVDARLDRIEKALDELRRRKKHRDDDDDDDDD